LIARSPSPNTVPGAAPAGAARSPGTSWLAVVPTAHAPTATTTVAATEAALPTTRRVNLPTRTGDATLHLSCTLHMAEPPVERERKVMYTSFRLPVMAGIDVEGARAAIRAVREGAHTIVSQAPGHRG